MTSLFENFVLCKTIALSILVLSKCRHKARHKASHQSSIRVQPFSTVRSTFFHSQIISKFQKLKSQIYY